MQMPEDARLFRDLSLLHDTVLSLAQRAVIVDSVPPEKMKMHEIYVQGLLGTMYICEVTPKNRAKRWLFQWLSQ